MQHQAQEPKARGTLSKMECPTVCMMNSISTCMHDPSWVFNISTPSTINFEETFSPRETAGTATNAICAASVSAGAHRREWTGQD